MKGLDFRRTSSVHGGRHEDFLDPGAPIGLADGARGGGSAVIQRCRN
jgi:hypothetical protein